MNNLLKSKIVQIALTVIIILPFLWYQNVNNEKINALIDRDGILIKATIINVYNGKGVFYEYFYKNKKYKKSSNFNNTPYFIVKCIDLQDCLGDTIIIKMSQSKPEYARIVKHSNAELPLH